MKKSIYFSKKTINYAKWEYNTTKDFDIIELDDNDNLQSIFYDKVMFFILVSLVPLFFRETYLIFTWIEYIVSVVFVIDYILRWITADLRDKKGIRSFLLYPLKISAIFDLLSILPAISYFNNSLRIFRTYRMFRVFRIAKVFRYYEPLQIVLEVFKKKADLLLTVIGFAFFYIIITALFMFNVENARNPDTGAIFFGDYWDAVYWAACTLTTVGYGDVYPISGVGRLVSIISALVGIAIIALPSGIITAGYMEETQERKEKKKSQENK